MSSLKPTKVYMFSALRTRKVSHFRRCKGHCNGGLFCRLIVQALLEFNVACLGTLIVCLRKVNGVSTWCDILPPFFSLIAISVNTIIMFIVYTLKFLFHTSEKSPNIISYTTSKRVMYESTAVSLA